MLGVGRIDIGAGFKFLRRECARDVLTLARDSRWFWDTELVYWTQRRGYSLASVPCRYRRNPAKNSTVRLLRDTWEHGFKLLKFKLSGGAFSVAAAP
jgi:hypothetical protein